MSESPQRLVVEETTIADLRKGQRVWMGRGLELVGSDPQPFTTIGWDSNEPLVRIEIGGQLASGVSYRPDAPVLRVVEGAELCCRFGYFDNTRIPEWNALTQDERTAIVEGRCSGCRGDGVEDTPHEPGEAALHKALRIACICDDIVEFETDDLFAEGLVHMGRDITGEAWSQPTEKGNEFVRAALAAPVEQCEVQPVNQASAEPVRVEQDEDERPRNAAGEALCFRCHKPQRDHWNGLECVNGPAGEDTAMFAAREDVPYTEREGFLSDPLRAKLDATLGGE